MGDAVLTDGEISGDAFEVLKANGDVKEDAQTRSKKATRKERIDRGTKKGHQKKLGVPNQSNK